MNLYEVLKTNSLIGKNQIINRNILLSQKFLISIYILKQEIGD